MSDISSPLASTLTIIQPSEVETVVQRRFNATAAELFAAWTTPDLVRRWWSHTGEMSTCDIDLRVGGQWRWAHYNAEHGMEVGYSGTYIAIDRPHVLEFTEAFEIMPGSDYTNKIAFDESGGTTLLTSRMTYSSQEWRDGHLAAGFEPGLREAYARIEALLTSLRNE